MSTDREIIDTFFAELERRVAQDPEAEYARRLRVREPVLRESAAQNPALFAQMIRELVHEL